MALDAIIVTGAAGGVGIEVCAQLSARYHIIGTVLDERERDRLLDRVPSATAVFADLSKAERLKEALAAPLGEAQALRAAVSCAAIWPGAPLELIDLYDLRRTLEINSIAPLALYQACIPALRRSRGRLVLVSSISGKLALPFNGAYGMSKYAVEALGDVCRREAAHWGVQTVLIEPGPIKTPMVTGMMDLLAQDRQRLSIEQEALYGGLFDSFSTMVETGYPTAVDPADVARAIADAIEMPDPPARLPVGPVAEFVCGLHKTHADGAIDQIALNVVNGNFGG